MWGGSWGGRRPQAHSKARSQIVTTAWGQRKKQEKFEGPKTASNTQEYRAGKT